MKTAVAAIFIWKAILKKLQNVNQRTGKQIERDTLKKVKKIGIEVPADLKTLLSEAVNNLKG